MFLNHRDAYTVPGLEDLFTGTWNIRETTKKLQRNQVFLRIKSFEKSIPGTIGHKTISYRDKRQKRLFYRDYDLKRLRTTGVS